MLWPEIPIFPLLFLIVVAVYCFTGWTHRTGRNIVVAFHCSMQLHVCQVYISSDDVDVVDDEKNDQLSMIEDDDDNSDNGENDDVFQANFCRALLVLMMLTWQFT